jgi:hypothetical protein
MLIYIAKTEGISTARQSNVNTDNYLFNDIWVGPGRKGFKKN